MTHVWFILAWLRAFVWAKIDLLTMTRPQDDGFPPFLGSLTIHLTFITKQQSTRRWTSKTMETPRQTINAKKHKLHSPMYIIWCHCSWWSPQFFPYGKHSPQETFNATIKHTATQKALHGPDACSRNGKRYDQDANNDAAANQPIVVLWSWNFKHNKTLHAIRMLGSTIDNKEMITVP